MIEGFNEAVSDDAASLAVLHDRELTAETLAALKAGDFPHGLGLSLPTDVAGRMNDLVRALPNATAAAGVADAALLDEFAAAYAEIYLTGGCQASPCESPWLDDDRIVCQAPMFEMRDLYKAAGLAASNWRVRPDDHLVLQLGYISHAARRAQSAADWRQLATVLDEHLLRWLPAFSERVGRRGHPFYACLAALTLAWVERLRDALALMLDEPRPTREQVEKRLKAQAAQAQKNQPVTAQPVTFVPGVGGPSW